MEVFFSLFLFIYLVFLGWVWQRWNRLPRTRLGSVVSELPGVTIVIPVRNEQEHIKALIDSLESVNYPQDKLEVIIIDDASTDKTPQLLNKHINPQGVLRWMRLEQPQQFHGSYKKRALTHGIKSSRFPVIITTDGDCLFHPHWVETMVNAMVSRNLVFASGPVDYLKDHAFAAPMNIELACLVATGAVSLQAHRPNMCNGANLCFLKEVFEEVGGYEGFEHIHSGDDEFLLYKIHQRYPKQVGFIKEAAAVVQTHPPGSLSELFNQRKRWSGKWKEHKSRIPGMLALSVFCFHLLLMVAVFGSLMGWYSWRMLIIQLAAKLLMEWLLVRSIYRFFGKSLSVGWILLMQLLYSIYVVIIGVTVQFSGYHWKKRHYQ